MQALSQGRTRAARLRLRRRVGPEERTVERADPRARDGDAGEEGVPGTLSLWGRLCL